MKLLLVISSILANGFSMLVWSQPSDTNIANEPLGGETTVNLGTTIQGNEEQPKVLYIVPWASASGPGELDPLGRQGNNVFRRVFVPVERIELRRQMHYLKQQQIETSEK